MKAIRVSQYGGPSVMKLEEVPAPQPGPTQVVVRNRAIGVNPVDTYLRSNTDNRGPKLPYTPGSDAAGVVEAVGASVTSVKAGDRVYFGGSASGAYGELSLCEQTQVHALSANASFAQGAAVNVPYATAYHALFHRAHAHEGESVLVHGASGGVGIGAVQLARVAWSHRDRHRGDRPREEARARAGRAARPRPHARRTTSRSSAGSPAARARTSSSRCSPTLTCRRISPPSP